MAALATLTPEQGEPYGTNAKGVPAVKGMALRGLSQILETPFEVDAHFACYAIEDEDGDNIEFPPRLTKGVLGQVVSAGSHVACHVVAVDLDLKDLPECRTAPKGPDGRKVPWSGLPAKTRDAVIARVNDAHAMLAKKGLPINVAYTTKNGFRFLHGLSEPVEAGPGYERLVSRVLASYKVAGLDVDTSCKDWTRLFRAPRVTLESGEQTWDQDWFTLEEDWTDLTSPTEEELAAEPEPEIAIEPLDIDEPDRESARALVETLGKNKQWVFTEAAKSARKELRDAHCFDAVFNQAPLAMRGNRHTALTQCIGEIIAAIHGFRWASPELVLGLVQPAADKLGTDDNGRTFYSKAWEMVSTFWVREQGRAEARARVRHEENVERAKKTLGLREQFVDGIRAWLEPAREMSDEEVLDHIRVNKLGVMVDAMKRDCCHVLMPDGFYSQYPVSFTVLPKFIEQTGMDWLLPTWIEVPDKQKEEPKQLHLTADMVRDRYASVYVERQIDFRHDGTFAEFDKFGRGQLRLVPFRLRTDIEPTFDERVDEWMRNLVLDTEVDDFLRAVACMLGIYHGPTAALALVGPKATGKKLLATGIAECFTGECAVPGDIITARFNAEALRSPLIWVDEGIGTGGIHDFADQFRRITTGGNLAVEPKGQEIIQCRGIHRVLITANNDSPVLRLAGRRGRTEDDWSALGERLAYFRLQTGASAYLQGLGGLSGTEGWIQGDNGTRSRYVVAKHLLWLYYNLLDWENGKPKRLGSRLLFEGQGSHRIIQTMEAGAGAVPEVALAINRLLRQAKAMGKGARAAVEEGKVYVTPQAVIAEAREHTSTKSSELREAFQSLLDEKQRDDRFYVNGTQQRWKTISARRLARIVEAHESVAEALKDYLPDAQIRP